MPLRLVRGWNKPSRQKDFLDIRKLIFNFPNERLYWVAHRFLWAVFPILMYLNEKGALESTRLSMQWVDACEHLADWAATESAYIENTRITSEEKDAMHPKVVELTGSLTEHFGNELHIKASGTYEQNSIIPKVRLLYEYYSTLLIAILKEYQHLMQRIDVQSELYQRYAGNLRLFESVIHACEVERIRLKRPTNVNPEKIDVLLTDIDAFAAQLGKKWREMVLDAVQKL